MANRIPTPEQLQRAAAKRVAATLAKAAPRTKPAAAKSARKAPARTKRA
jgi:hypothetical protein